MGTNTIGPTDNVELSHFVQADWYYQIGTNFVSILNGEDYDYSNFVTV